MLSTAFFNSNNILQMGLVPIDAKWVTPIKKRKRFEIIKNSECHKKPKLLKDCELPPVVSSIKKRKRLKSDCGTPKKPKLFNLCKTPISEKPIVQHLMSVIEKKLGEINFKKNKSERDKKKRQFSNLWQFKLGHSTQALGAGGHKTPHNFKQGRGVCTRPIAERNFPKWKKDLYATCDKLINEIDPDFAKDGHYAVNFSCMTDTTKHYVKVHTDSHDISHQYGIVLGENVKGGHLTCWNSNGTTQTVDYHRKILKMDGRLQHSCGKFEGRRYCVIFYKLYDPRKVCEDPIFEPARLI